MKLKPVVGQPLWYVPRYTVSRPVIVSKAGTKWIYFGNGGLRCDYEGVIDSQKYDFAGRCYQNQAVYDVECELLAAWRDIRKRIEKSHNPPEGITIDMINQARVWLFGGEK